MPEKKTFIKMANITLIGNPVSVNSLYRGRRFLTARGKETKDDYIYQALNQYKGKIMKGEISVDLAVYFRSKKTSDLDNVLKATLDSLTGLIWEDDRQIVQISAVKMQDKENPRIELKVKQIKA